MRTDAKVSTRKTIKCPNASTIGVGKWKAQVGDVIVYNQRLQDGSYIPQLARMIGSVTAPKIDPKDREVKDFLLVLTLADDAHTAYERWVDPKDVTRIITSPTRFATWFFQEKLPYDAHTLRRLHDYGSLSDDYIEGAAERVATWRKQEKKR